MYLCYSLENMLYLIFIQSVGSSYPWSFNLPSL